MDRLTHGAWEKPAESEPPNTHLKDCWHVQTKHQVPAKFPHAQLGYCDAKEASKAPTRIQAHPEAAYAENPPPN